MAENHSTRQTVYQGRKIRLDRETATGPDGRPYQRDIIVHPGAVAILPLHDTGQLCLVRNQRSAVGGTLLEIPAGTLEPDEPPDQAAIRELAEETGYRAGRWRKLTEFFPSPGVLSEITHLFLAEQLTPGPMALEQDEQIEPILVSWPDALRWALDGTLRDAKTLIAILLWAQIREATADQRQ